MSDEGAAEAANRFMNMAERAFKERDGTREENARLRDALRPLASHADIIEQYFTAEELAAMDHDHHLVAHGITVADCFRARAALTGKV